MCGTIFKNNYRINNYFTTTATTTTYTPSRLTGYSYLSTTTKKTLEDDKPFLVQRNVMLGWSLSWMFCQINEVDSLSVNLGKSA